MALTSDAPVRRHRADFERNRSEILAQAERHFAAEGVGASLEAVARDAGVESATLYRHSPTRDVLLAEVLERRATQIEAEIERIEAMSDSGAALAAWLVAMEDFFGAYEGLPQVRGLAGRPRSPDCRTRRCVRAASTRQEW